MIVTKLKEVSFLADVQNLLNAFRSSTVISLNIKYEWKEEKSCCFKTGTKENGHLNPARSCDLFSTFFFSIRKKKNVSIEKLIHFALIFVYSEITVDKPLWKKSAQKKANKWSSLYYHAAFRLQLLKRSTIDLIFALHMKDCYLPLLRSKEVFIWMYNLKKNKHPTYLINYFLNRDITDAIQHGIFIMQGYLLHFDTRAYLFSPDKRSCHIFSTQNSCLDFISSDGVTLQSDASIIL